MNLVSPIQSVIPSAHGSVLGVLVRTAQPLSGRRVAELTRPKVSQARVNAVLGDLTASGITLLEKHPPAHLYRLNREHVAADGIIALVEMWSRFLDRVRSELKSWRTPAEAAWLFGSAARGEATSTSDIDILLIRPSAAADAATWEQQTERLTAHVLRWTGNTCELLEMTRSELESIVERDDSLASDLRADALHLAGATPRSLLRHRPSE